MTNLIAYSIFATLVAVSCLNANLQAGIQVGNSNTSRSILFKRSVVDNGNFEQWSDGKPVGWTLGKGHYKRDTVMKTGGSASLCMYPDRNQSTRWLSTRVQQRIELAPNTSYRLKLWMAKDGEGKVLIRIRPIIKGRVNASGAVLDWSNGWSRFFAWTPVALPFHTGEYSRYELSIVQFGSPKEPMWVDRVAIDSPDSSIPIDINDSRRGFVWYCPSLTTPFEKQVVPKSDWIHHPLSITAAKGEYGAAILGLRALKSLDGVDIALDSDLIGPHGTSIDTSHVTLRMLSNYALLPVTKARSVKAQRNIGWWVTIKSGQKQLPGDYRGRLRITINGTALAMVPIVVHVLPFALPKPNITFLAYYNERYFPAGFLSDSLRQEYYYDMREHGMNSVTVYNNPDINGKAVDFNHNQAYNPKYFHYKSLNKHGYKLTEQAVKNRFDYGLNQVMPMIDNAGLGKAGHPVLWLFSKSGKYNWGGMPEQAMKASVKAWQKKKDWPAPLLYVNDEPEGHPDRIAAARRVLDNIKQWGLPIKTVTANIPVKTLGDYYDVWIQLDRRLTPGMVQVANEKNAQLWVYDCNMPTDNGVFTRDMFGFWAYRSGLKGVALWAYYDAKDWYYDAQGKLHGENGQFDLSRICPSPTGPVPTISWETTRMGVDDYCYAQLFDHLIHKAKDRSESLSKQAHALLSSDAIAALDAWQQQMNHKSNSKDKPLEWSPKGQKQAEGQSLYLASLELLRQVSVAEQVRKQVIESIPFDALAVSRALPFMAANQHFYPALGPGNAIAAAANKRRALIPYITRLLRAIDHTAPEVLEK